MDMMVDDASASQISDKLKDLLYTKSAERVDAFRPTAANSLFGEPPQEEPEVEDALATASAEISGDAAAAREAGEE